MTHQHWNQFWNQGFITTFGASLQENYTGEIRDFWAEVFSQICNGDDILDLATGNGALACIAAEELKKNQVSAHIYAADAASIPAQISAPSNVQELRKSISFFSKMPCEELTFPDGKFQLVTSQYGIEYSDLRQSLAEVFRVLGPGGAAHFICHHRDSSLLANSINEISIYTSAIEQNQIFEFAIDFSKLFSRVNSAEKTCASAALNQAVNDFRDKHRDQELGQILIADIAGHLKLLKSENPESVITKLESRQSEYKAAYARLRDMEAAALSERDLEEVLKAAASIGFRAFGAEKIKQADELIGVHIQLTK